MNMRRELLKWMISKKEFTTHEVIQWGSEHFYNTADREKRHYAETGYLEALCKEEKMRKGYDTKEGVYLITQKAINENLLIRL